MGKEEFAIALEKEAKTLIGKIVSETSLAREAFWTNKAECDDAEKKHNQRSCAKKDHPSIRPSSYAAEIAKARQHIKEPLTCIGNADAMIGKKDIVQKVVKRKIENKI